MKCSKNNRVNDFLNKLELVNPEQYVLLDMIRRKILDTSPRVAEKIVYGGVVFFSEDNMFCGIFTYKNHVTIEFSNGYIMEDPNSILKGKGKYRRHLKFKSKSEIETKDLAFFINQST